MPTSSSSASQHGLVGAPAEVSVSASALADSIMQAWVHGEQTGDYRDFLPQLGSALTGFSHPVAGAYTGPQAADRLRRLVEEQREGPDRYTYEEPQLTAAPPNFLYQFEATRRQGSQIVCHGHVLLALKVTAAGLTDFRLYCGLLQFFMEYVR